MLHLYARFGVGQVIINGGLKQIYEEQKGICYLYNAL